MTTWANCIADYAAMFEAYSLYLNKHLGTPTLNTFNDKIKFSFLDRFYINFLNIQDMLVLVAEHEGKFLSLGLILRGVLSDVINYRYLNKVHDEHGPERFSEEVRILDRDFVNAYADMTGNEVKRANKGKSEDTIKEELSKNKATVLGHFKDFRNDQTGNIKGHDEIRNPEFAKYSLEYLKEIHKTNNPPSLSTESGKMKFVHDDDAEVIAILYKYMSQLQHYSNIATNIYKMDGFVQFNPHLTLLVLYYSITTIKTIIHDIKPHESTENTFSNFIGKFV